MKVCSFAPNPSPKIRERGADATALASLTFLLSLREVSLYLHFLNPTP